MFVFGFDFKEKDEKGIKSETLENSNENNNKVLMLFFISMFIFVKKVSKFFVFYNHIEHWRFSSENAP